MIASAFAISNAISDIRIRSSMPKEPEEKLANVFQQKHLVQYCLLDGAVFANLALFLVTQNVFSIATTTIALAMMAFSLPRIATGQEWS